MDKKHDGHAWYKVKMNNIKNDFNLNFRRAWYLDHLQCWNDAWSGDVVHELQGYYFALSLPFCRTCNITFLCVKLCLARMYYIVHKQDNLTQTTIHLGLHDHSVVEGCSKKNFKQVKSLVKEEASRTLGAIVLAIGLVTSKTFLLEHLLNKDGQGLVEVLKGDKFCQVMDKFLSLSFLNVRNLVTSSKHQLGNKGYVSSIFALKANNC